MYQELETDIPEELVAALIRRYHPYEPSRHLVTWRENLELAASLTFDLLGWWPTIEATQEVRAG